MTVALSKARGWSASRSGFYTATPATPDGTRCARSCGEPTGRSCSPWIGSSHSACPDSVDELDRGGELRSTRHLQRDVQEAEPFQIVGAGERPGIDRPEPAGLDDLRKRPLGTGVVTGDEHVERLVLDLSLDERPGEGGVERLDDPGTGRCAFRDLLGRRAVGRGDEPVEGLYVDGVGDVDDDLAGELVAVLLDQRR